MSDEDKRKSKRLAKLATVAGLVAGLSCHLLPPEYKQACDVATSVVRLTCDGNH